MSLRDALLKAGKVTRQQVQGAAADSRKERKQKGGGHRIEAEAREVALARDAERKAQQAEENRARAARLEAERQEHERLMRIGNLIAAWSRRSSPRAARRWHFVRSNGHIGFVVVDRNLAAELEYGAAGIVELPDRPDAVRVVAGDAVRKLADLHPGGIRFFLGAGGPDDPLVRPPRLEGDA